MAEKPTFTPPEALDEASPLGHENYAAQAEDTLNTAFPDGRPDPNGYRDARETWINEERREGRSELASLSEVLLDAPLVRPIQEELTEAQARKDLAIVEKLKPTVIKFNHELRDLIFETPPGMFTRDELAEWLRTASNDRFGSWVEPMLNGIIAEVAAVKRLQADPKVETVRFATAAEETKNIDVVATLKPEEGQLPQTRRIQVKCGQHRLIEPVTVHPNGVAEVGFTPDMLKGFGFAQGHRAEASAQLHQVLVLGFTPGRPRF